jgi:hypothetical protein
MAIVFRAKVRGSNHNKCQYAGTQQDTNSTRAFSRFIGNEKVSVYGLLVRCSRCLHKKDSVVEKLNLISAVCDMSICEGS